MVGYQISTPLLLLVVISSIVAFKTRVSRYDILSHTTTTLFQASSYSSSSSKRRSDSTPYSDDTSVGRSAGRRRSSGSNSNRYNDNNENNMNNENKSSSPWNTLIRKLDVTKSSKEKFGKIIVEKADASLYTPDLLQCPHFATCAGCSMFGNFSDAPVVRRAMSFFRSENIMLQVHHNTKFTSNIRNANSSSSTSSPSSNGTFVIERENDWFLHWRTHVKLAVQPLSKWGGLKIGLFRSGTHEVEPIPSCQVHHPRINEAGKPYHTSFIYKLSIVY